MKQNSEYQYVVNDYGIRIKKCCASCAQKALTGSFTFRRCMRKKKKVRPCEVCRYWQLSCWLQQLGRERKEELKIRN